MTAGWAIAAGCSRPLPEAGSPAAELYRSRCGTSCHAAVAPRSMKYKLWEMVLPRMERRIGEAGEPPLTAAERESIRSYLERNAERD
ncbi:MAG: cytochrome C [Candidatus Binatia bacterium]